MDSCDINAAFKHHLPVMAEVFAKNSSKLKQHQIDCIDNVVRKDNTLCIMPTGGGKSLIYWLAGYLLGGITIVVSPLIALIGEQEEKLTEQGVKVLALHSGMSQIEQAKKLTQFARGEVTPKFIFASPEKLATDGFFGYCIKARKDEIKLLVIDEVHCVSQWGPSFRPFYRSIPNFLQDIFGDEQPRILAMTATLNPKELDDICCEFSIDKNCVLKDNSLMRTEISLKVIKVNLEDEKDGTDGKLWNYLRIHKDEKTLVYVYRKYKTRSVEELAERASIQYGIKSTFFHGDMSSNERKDIINKFKNNEVNVVFATNAFGMGIDIPDIKVIIHFMLPESVEQYYQEVGRGARNIESANAYLFYSNKNVDVKRKHFIDNSFPTRQKLVDIYKKISAPANSLRTLPYFDDEEIQQCLHYYISCGAIQIVTKGFSDMKALKNVKNAELSRIIASSKTQNLITSSKKADVDVSDIIDMVYSSIVNRDAETTKPLDKRLVIAVQNEELTEAQLDDIMAIIDERRKYRHDLLDYFLFLLENTGTSIELHQEIARYLGIDKNMLNKIYSTSKGDKVRSKSEVIIANLLYQHNIKYEYELPLEYENGKSIKPDFTIFLPNGRKLYWEHLGMLGREDYDKSWLYKIDIYSKYYPEQMVKTYEGVTITDNVLELIDNIKAM